MAAKSPPTAPKKPGRVSLPAGFCPPMPGMAPAGLAEALAKRRQQRKSLGDDNNNEEVGEAINGDNKEEPKTNGVDEKQNGVRERKKRVSDIQAGLNLNLLGLRPPVPGGISPLKPGCPPPGGVSPLRPSPGTPPQSQSEKPLDLSKPLTQEHQHTLLSNTAAKTRARISVQRRPPTRSHRSSTSSSTTSPRPSLSSPMPTPPSTPTPSSTPTTLSTPPRP